MNSSGSAGTLSERGTGRAALSRAAAARSSSRCWIDVEGQHGIVGSIGRVRSASMSRPARAVEPLQHTARCPCRRPGSRARSTSSVTPASRTPRRRRAPAGHEEAERQGRAGARRRGGGGRDPSSWTRMSSAMFSAIPCDPRARSSRPAPTSTASPTLRRCLDSRTISEAALGGAPPHEIGPRSRSAWSSRIRAPLHGTIAAALIASFSPCLRMWNRSCSGFDSRNLTSCG